MSAESSRDVQAGVYARLAAESGITGLLAAGAAGIFDHVPAGAPFPYIVLGETESQPLDCQAFSGNELACGIHIYSRSAGMSEAKTILRAVYDSLHDRDFSVPNQILILCRMTGSETRLEPDGLTRHAHLRFQIITEPA